MRPNPRPATLAFYDNVLATLRRLEQATAIQVAAYVADPDKIHGPPYTEGYKNNGYQRALMALKYWEEKGVTTRIREYMPNTWSLSSMAPNYDMEEYERAFTQTE